MDNYRVIFVSCLFAKYFVCFVDKLYRLFADGFTNTIQTLKQNNNNDYNDYNDN